MQSLILCCEVVDLLLQEVGRAPSVCAHKCHAVGCPGGRSWWRGQPQWAGTLRGTVRVGRGWCGILRCQHNVFLKRFCQSVSTVNEVSRRVLKLFLRLVTQRTRHAYLFRDGNMWLKDGSVNSVNLAYAVVPGGIVPVAEYAILWHIVRLCRGL